MATTEMRESVGTISAGESNPRLNGRSRKPHRCAELRATNTDIVKHALENKARIRRDTDRCQLS